MARNPNHAPQRVSPKPWAMPVGQAPPAPPPEMAVPSAGGHSIGTYMQQLTPPPPPKAEPVKVSHAISSGGESSTTLAALAGLAPDAEMKEDLVACRGRLDAVGLRLSSQDNAVKTLERSLSALREEYSRISQTTDGQSHCRLEACERAVARLDAAFQEFSTSMQREVRSTENLIASQAAQASPPPIMCRLLEDDGDFNALETMHLYTPMHLNAASDVCLYRRKFNPKKNTMEETDFVVQTSTGEPRVVFI